MMRRLFVLLVVGLMFSSYAHARLLVLSGGDSNVYQRFVVSLNKNFDEETGLVEVMAVANLNDNAKLDEYKVIVVAGLEAAKWLADKKVGKTHVVYALLPHDGYSWLENNSKITVSDHYVLFLDQPPARYVHLVRHALPGLKSLGFVAGDVSKFHADMVKQTAVNNGISYVQAVFSPRTKLLPALKSLLSESEALLLLPDPYFYNRHTVHALLLSTVRAKRPLIAFSESFVEAGALMAVFSTPEQMGKQTAEIVNCIIEECRQPYPRISYPKYFSVKMNEFVARQLGLEIKSAEELQRLIQ